MTKTPMLLALAASAAMAVLPSIAAAQSYSDQQSYAQQQADYQQRLQQYNEQRAAYDRQYSGRQDSQDWRRDDRGGYDNGRYDNARRDGGPCNGRSNDGSTAAGGLLGALAGGAIGSQLAGRGSHTEGAVLGAVAGGVIGAGIASSSAQCDQTGYYYSYNQTMDYREPSDYRGRQSGRYDYDHYRRNGCRLVAAPTQWNGQQETRYVRACPDGSGRYRLAE